MFGKSVVVKDGKDQRFVKGLAVGNLKISDQKFEKCELVAAVAPCHLYAALPHSY